MTEESPIRVETEGHVTTVTLDRPAKRNAMTRAFFDEIGETFNKIHEDTQTRVVLIQAEGKSFSAGLDLGETATLLQESTPDARETLRLELRKIQDSFTAVERCRKPVIAAVQGHCIGGGLDLICACDIRLCSKDAIFSIRETRLAMIADLGTLQRLPHIIGHGWFRELALTGRDFTAEEALSMGLVTRVCDDRESLLSEATRKAAEIAALSPIAVQGAKEVILVSRDSGVHEGLEYVARKNSSALHCDDLFEAVQAFMTGREPEFKGK